MRYRSNVRIGESMRKLFVVLGGTCLWLGGCATGPTRLDFAKPGVTDIQRTKDVEACWTYTFNTKEGQDKVSLLKASRVIGGGLVAVAVMASNESSQGYDRKKDANHVPVHNDCMRDKGYDVKMVALVEKK